MHWISKATFVLQGVFFSVFAQKFTCKQISPCLYQFPSFYRWGI